MEQLVHLAVFAAVLLSHPGWVSTQTNCPWDEPGLLLWSEASTWDGGAVPADDDEVRFQFCCLFTENISGRERQVSYCRIQHERPNKK